MEWASDYRISGVELKLLFTGVAKIMEIKFTNFWTNLVLLFESWEKKIVNNNKKILNGKILYNIMLIKEKVSGGKMFYYQLLTTATIPSPPQSHYLISSGPFLQFVYLPK